MSTRMLAVTASVVFLLIGATGAGIFFKKMNVDIERHVPFQLGEIPADARPKFVEQWAAISAREDVLLTVVQKNNLVAQFGVADEKAAVAELRKRTRVVLKDDGLTMQTFAAGKRKELDLLNRLCGALFEETRLKYVAGREGASRTPGQESF
ncbi:MAG: hypothetical protein ACON5H_06435 [Akkermansiaceae bacterium]